MELKREQVRRILQVAPSQEQHVRDLEAALATYLRKATDTFDLSRNVEVSEAQALNFSADFLFYVVLSFFFPPNRAPKMRESQQLFVGLRLVSRKFEENQHSAIQTKIEHHFGGFFQQIKGRQPIRSKDSKQTVIPTSWRLDSFLYEAAQNFELF